MKMNKNISLCGAAIVVLITIISMAMVSETQAEDASTPSATSTPTDSDPNMPWLKAVISKNTITVGQSAVVTLSGGQLDASEGDFLEDYGSEFASIVEVVQIDEDRFEVKGIGPGNAVLKFSDGKNEASVKIRVTAK